MGARGFFAELQRQAKRAQRERIREAKAAHREYAAAVRHAEVARRAEERALVQLARASAAEKKRIEKELREAHVEAMIAEVEQRNRELDEVNDELDSLLLATLEVDDYVDLDALRTVAVHPPFDRPELERPLPPPRQVQAPTEPIYTPPRAPNWFVRTFAKASYERTVARSVELHDVALRTWRNELELYKHRRDAAREEHARAEAQRISTLRVERSKYEAECAEREAIATRHNAAIDALNANIAYGDPCAIEEYVGMVTANSVYPDHFPVDFNFGFDSPTAELQLRVAVPSPDKLNSIKSYKYKKATDEVVETQLSQRECKERYAEAVAKVALRSFHEVFESDRRGIIKTVSLQVGTETDEPATGHHKSIPLIAATAERESFLRINLAAVVPLVTLNHLGASVSKNPFDLVPVKIAGVRVA